MSKHNIHGIEVEINVNQGRLTAAARGRCIGRVVNLCRELPRDEFVAAMGDFEKFAFGGPQSAALLEKLDAALAENYTPAYEDDFAPIASIRLA